MQKSAAAGLSESKFREPDSLARAAAGLSNRPRKRQVARAAFITEVLMAIIKAVVPDDWVPHVDADAAARGETPSEWLRAAIKSRLSAQRRKLLSVPRGRGQPRKANRSDV